MRWFWRRRAERIETPKPSTPPEHPYEIAYVYPRVGATADDLITLGGALRDWAAANEPSITNIVGLEELLNGEFPQEEIYMGSINPRTLAAPPWKKCPAVLCSPDVEISNRRVIDGLKRDLPPGLYSGISWPPMD